MKKLRWLLASVALATWGGASAGEFSATVTATTDYDFRGVTQTAQDPALQASIDWAADGGFYTGAWASNVDFGDCCDESVELDLYVGFGGGDEEGLTWDVGAVYYLYPGGDNLDYPEIYAGVAYGIFDVYVWYSWDFFAYGESAYYLEGNVNIPLPQDFGLVLHAGYNGGDSFPTIDPVEGVLIGDSYVDYKVGVTKTWGNFEFELAWVDGSDYEVADGTPDNVLSSEGRAIFTVSTTFPW